MRFYARLGMTISLLLLAACGGSDVVPAPGDVVTVQNDCDAPRPILTFLDFQNASAVIGQANFFSNDAGGPVGGTQPPSAATLGSPTGLSCGSLWVADFWNSRILKYALPIWSPGQPAVLVIGQAGFTTREAETTASRLRLPAGVAQHNGRLYVADTFNNRVLIWNSIPSTNGQSASVVVGHADFTTHVSNVVSASDLSLPERLAVLGTRLIVADTGNNRVLVWNEIPQTNAVPADLVLGQADFVSSGWGIGVDRLDAPCDIWTDGMRLAVADRGNNRVLIWNTFPTTNGQAADVVVGQMDFDSSDAIIGPATLHWPNAVFSNGPQLIVADTGHNRVLIWNSFPTVAFAPADAVLGQGDFNHDAPNDNDQDALEDVIPRARTLSNPRHVFQIDYKLYVADTDNNRVLVFDGSSRVPK